VEEYCKNKYDGPMPSELHSLQHMARGLAYIHFKKLFHRDVKPENILISLPDESGAVQLKISDFGLCKPTSENGTCSASGIKGTPVYTAPEVLSLGGRPLDGARMSYSSDVFSLGCTFFYFLTKGTHPFGSQTIKIPNNIVNGRPELSSMQI
jgi:serine/threonine protein kinase